MHKICKILRKLYSQNTRLTIYTPCLIFMPKRVGHEFQGKKFQKINEKVGHYFKTL